MSPISTKPTKRDELRLLVNSRHPIITVETSEEERVEQLLYQIGTELDVPVYTWSVTKGLARFRGEPLYHTDDPGQALANISIINGDAIFLLKDFARYCENDKICRRLRELGENFRTARRSIVITGANMAATLAKTPTIYSDAKRCAAVLPAVRERLSVAMVRLASLYPNARFPPVTVAVGRGRPVAAGGPTDGVMVGLEALCGVKYFDANVEDRFVHVIAHEYIHVQQSESLTKDEHPTVLEVSLVEGAAEFIAYQRLHPDFPDQSTADQWFDEPQLEAYRTLGHHIMTSLVEACDTPPASLHQLFDQLAHLDPITFTQRLREVDIEPAALRSPQGA